MLSLVILLQPLSKLMLVAEYQVNKNYIAEFLCVNKSKPRLKCEGKCQLSKELKAADAHEKNHPTPVEKMVEVVQFFQPAFTFSPQFPTVIKPAFRYFSNPKVTAPAFGIFHPPCFLV
ncbi:hypothetical protein I5M27_12195 [Adhaeribacter sp. BT258]|uniref:Uncharacterized protein n=1 Tax=Adhaeribacter terrigena TaxID=2793070 RepID=A0ABS1C2X4_9BACT|nr:hypothetical protein [Adhaeribacter terrigena]MBK0403752.1 hypothetical protein [Adhaeribacter terrigena]